MYWPDPSGIPEVRRSASEFLRAHEPQSQHGYYYTEQDLVDERLERALQQEYQLEQLREAAEQQALNAGHPLEKGSLDSFTVSMDNGLAVAHSQPLVSREPQTSSRPPPPIRAQPSQSAMHFYDDTPPDDDPKHIFPSSVRTPQHWSQPPSQRDDNYQSHYRSVDPKSFQQQQSAVHIDLSHIKDEQIRQAVDPNSDISMTELAQWDEAKLDALVEAFSPEYLPGMIRKSMTLEKGEAAKSLSWNNLCYEDKQGQHLLKSVCGHLHPGMITGILAGPDGGATPLLNVLAGREKRKDFTGDVLYNGAQPGRDYIRQIGYVVKDDQHIAQLTVFETLWFSARLRLPQRIPDKLVRFRVMIVMKLLGLSHVADSIVGDATVRGISGGEKRRVSFGVEMVAGRQVLLADLPTNGLDSAAAYGLIRTMRFATKAGSSMMCSIVQPSPELFRLFHRVAVLSKGAVLYFGPSTHVERFFREAGFQRPLSKSLPQFLEELSAAPEMFYVHRFNKELRANGQGAQYASRLLDNKDKQFELGRGKNKPDDSQEGKQQVSKAATSLPLSSTAGDNAGSPLARSRSPSATDVTSTNSGNGQHAEHDNSELVQRPEHDNTRIQCWNLLVDRYEASKWKQIVYDEWAKDQQGATERWDKNYSLAKVDSQWNKDIHSQQHEQNDNEKLHGYNATKSPTHDRRTNSGSGGGEGDGSKGEYLAKEDHGLWNWWFRRYNASFTLQFVENLKRMTKIFIRNVGLWRNTWLRAAFIGLILGSLFYDLGSDVTSIRNRVGLIFFLSLYLGFGGIQLLPVIISQRPVYYAQNVAGYYHGFAYYFSLQLVQLPLLIIETTLLLTPVWGLSHLYGGTWQAHYWFAFIVLMVTSLISRAWVMILLALSPIEAMAHVLLTMTNILFVVLCGFLISSDAIVDGWYWFHVISYFTYVFRALVVNDISPLTNDCVVGTPGCPYNTGVAALQAQYTIDGNYDKWYDFARLCGIYISFSLGAAVIYSVINWDSPDSPEAPDWGEDEREHRTKQGLDGGDASGNQQQSQIMKQKKQPLLSRMKSKIIYHSSNPVLGTRTQEMQEADADPLGVDVKPQTTVNQHGSQTRGSDAKQVGQGPKKLATSAMRARDDSIPMPIPEAALRVVKAKKSFSSPALLQPALVKELRQKEREHCIGTTGNINTNRSSADGCAEQRERPAVNAAQSSGNQEIPPPMLRAASHDFGFDVESKETESLVSGKRAYMQWRDLDYTVQLDNGSNRQLLNKCFGYVRPGVMCALMGASGAGKSSLLDVLANKKTSGQISGEILINGRPRDETFTRIAGYVEQFDSHNPMSTVREAIAFSGRMRLPQSVSDKELELKVKNVLEVLGLAHLADYRIGSPGFGGVSPEVRKKVTIGVELIAEPSLLFLDEPTTGLDSAGAFAVMTAVHTLSKHMAIICTVHQPSTELTKMFDDILLMKDCGEVVYMGPMSDLATYFAQNKLGECPAGRNPVDFALAQLKKCNEISKKGSQYRLEDKQKQQLAKQQSQGVLGALRNRLGKKSNEDQRRAEGNGKDTNHGDGQPEMYRDETKDNNKDTGGDADIDDDIEMQQPGSARTQEHVNSTAVQSSSRGGKIGDTAAGATEFEDLSAERASDLPKLFLDSPNYQNIAKKLDDGVMPDDEKQAYQPPDMKSSHASQLTQIVWLTHRNFTNVWRNTFGLAIRYFLIFVFVLFIGLIFLRLQYGQVDATQRSGAVFLILVNVMFSTNAFLPEIYANRPIYFREYTANMYSAFSYFVARYVGDAPYVAGEVILYSFVYFFIDVNGYEHNRFYGFFLWIILALRYTGIALTHFFGTAIAAPDDAATLEITFFNVMLAFTGFLIPGPSIPSWWVWLYDISFIRYALNVMTYFVFIHENYSCSGAEMQPVSFPYTAGCELTEGQNARGLDGALTDPLGASVVYKCPIACSYDLFDQFGIDPSTDMVIQNFGILHCFAIFFFVIAFLALRFINHVKR